MVLGLSVTGLLVGAILGRVHDKLGAFVGLLPILASYYLAGRMASPYHSFAGDLLDMLISSVPACLATSFGFTVSQKRSMDVEPGRSA